MSEKKEETIYVGNGVEKFDGDLIEFSVNLSKCKPHEFTYGGERYVKLKVNKKKEVDQYGKTHSVSVNTWKPEPVQTEIENDPF